MEGRRARARLAPLRIAGWVTPRIRTKLSWYPLRRAQNTGGCGVSGQLEADEPLHHVGLDETDDDAPAERQVVAPAA